MTDKPTINPETPGLNTLQQALDDGDIALVRRQLTHLDEHERATLRLELGEQQYAQVYSLVRRAPRGASMGNVIVLHGIMGGNLAVRRKNDTDNVWINYWRLAKGRIADLELDAQGGPADPAVQVIVKGQQRKYYLPMVLKLDQHWNVKPFAYDWRKDIRHSAMLLAQTINAFSSDTPVHLVAHSMGGLVSRYMIHLFPDLWKRIADGEGLARGGRLVMLGTPNHGSYSIPVALTGAEKQLKLLAKLDLAHGLEDLLEITNTFAGSYQMLPSPALNLEDDHGKLFDAAQWGRHPVHKPLLERASQFHGELKTVVDGERFIYVAGYNRDTPHRVHIEAPGQFRYQVTRDGDGRVPHELGLLDGVPTFWTDATHGDLARDADVLDAIDELLESGSSQVLPSRKPATRAAPDPTWHEADVFQPALPDIESILNRESRSTRARKSRLTGEEQLRVENALHDGFTGSSRGADSGRGKGRPPGSGDRRKPAIRVEVVWGDITQTEGDVFTVGHYQGVLPQVAELALDAAISHDPDRSHPECHVLRQHTLRGTLRGALGDVNFFPWKRDDGKQRVVAVAGMGHIGGFTPAAARTMARTLVWAVAGLQQIQTVCTVLIGSGEGSLTVDEALDGLVRGIADALSGELAHTSSAIQTLRIVEIYRDRAEQIHEYLQQNQARFSSHLTLDLSGKVSRGDNARISPEDGLSLVIDAVIAAAAYKRGTRRRDQFEALLNDSKRAGLRKSELRNAIEQARELEAATESSARFFVSRRPEAGNHWVPFRLSYLTDGDDIRAAAISDTATVSERVLRFDRKLVEEVSNEVMDPDAPLRGETPGFLRNLVLPVEFHTLIDRGESFVFEVDRAMAQVPWEVLASGRDAQNTEPLAIRAQVARQLRTAYSSRPGVAEHRGNQIRALVIGDPGDPEQGDNLPGAEREALAVHDLLKSRGVQVDLLVGAIATERIGRLREFPAATRVRVMEKLILERYDILHYCGHGDFDPSNTSRAGWLFADGLLTAYELERVGDVPGFVVANACLSGRTSQRITGQRLAQRARDDLALLPSLADEFFRRGVLNYIGTAWEVSDEGAVLFARELYDELLPQPEESGPHAGTVGGAVARARKALHARGDIYGKLWAAYQHYGDPTSAI